MVDNAGVTVMVVRTAGETVNVVEPLIEPDEALMTTLPVATPVAIPEMGSIVALLVSEELQAAAVRVCVLPSAKVAMAVNCWV
jgi:hypothetical protein